MSKEELEEEAKEKAKQYANENELEYNCESTKLEIDNYNVGLEIGYKDGYLAGAGPREEQIAHLEKSLIDVSEKSIKHINELKAKIEEIKRDVNECFGYEYNILVAKLLDKWEIKEK